MRTNEKHCKDEFRIENPPVGLADSDLVDLLTKAYVGGGFTSAKRAASLFEPSAIRSRGDLICARANENDLLAGMVIVVTPSSAARRLAEIDEAEIHLLAVHPQYHGRGLGRILVTEALKRIAAMGFQKTILWTQPTMIAAQQLYEAVGFVRADTRDPTFDGLRFLAYEMQQ